jgi:hypothetical protein
MKLIFAALVIISISSTIISCKSSSGSGPKSFCDTVCLKDSIKMTGDHKLKPYVYITAKDCKADSLIWSYQGINNRKTGFTYLLNTTVNINKDFARCYFRDTAVAYLLFNDCATGRGFQIKLPFDKKQNFGLKSSGINNFDPKFSVADNLLVNTDRGNIYAEDMQTGKTAMMTFGKKLDIDYDNIHEYIDSVNITNDRIWVKVLVDNKWTELEKKIELK